MVSSRPWFQTSSNHVRITLSGDMLIEILPAAAVAFGGVYHSPFFT